MNAHADGLQFDGTYPAIWDEFVDYWTDPETQRRSAAAFARDHGLNPSSVRAWVTRNPTIKRLIEKRYEDLNLSPDRIQKVVDAMYDAAAAGDTKAATLYLQFVERLSPKKIVIEDKRTSDLTDDELAAELRELVASGSA